MRRSSCAAASRLRAVSMAASVPPKSLRLKNVPVDAAETCDRTLVATDAERPSLYERKQYRKPSIHAIADFGPWRCRTCYCLVRSWPFRLFIAWLPSSPIHRARSL